MYKQVTSEQRSQIFVFLQKKTSRKEISELISISESTLSRALKRNSTDKGHYIWNKANEKVMFRRKRTTTNSKKDETIIWEALELLNEKQWSPKQISGYLALKGKKISHELIYRYIRADDSGKLSSNCRHKMKYNRHGRHPRTTKVRSTQNRISIHERPPEANGKRFRDLEMDTILSGKTEREQLLL